MDEKIAQFTELTGATPEQASFYLQSADGDVETAISTFYESGGAQAGTGTGTMQQDMDNDDDDGDAEMQAALANTTEGLNDENAIRSTGAGSGQALGGQTLGGGPAPATSSSPGSGQATTYKKKSEVRTTQKKTFGSLGSLARDQDDSDDDKPQDFYTGGEKSGLSVEDPNKKKKQRDDPDGPNDLVKSLLKKAAEGSAARGEGPDGQQKKPKASTSSWFGGSGNTLGSEETPSETIPDPNARPLSPASQGPGGLASRLGMLPQLRNFFGQNPAAAASAIPEEDRPEDWEEDSVTRHLTLWREGFSVEDGPLMRYDDPKNMQTLKAIQEGAAPTHILKVRFGQQVELRVAQRTNDDFEEPPPKPMKPFSGGGNRLGSPAPAVTSSSATSAPAQAAAAPPTTTTGVSPSFQVDGTKPVTTLQIRLGDGTRQTARFNLTHTIGDIRNWINAGNPGMSSRQYMLMTTFPNKDLDDESKTIDEAGVKGSVVTQRWL